MHRALPRAAMVLCALAVLPAPRGPSRTPASATPQLQQGAAPFGADVARLSEPEGLFDTDNLVSNEISYLHVVPALVAKSVSGGAYVGVGPDQNFSYIARIRPSVAYIIDVRRDNLLLHLLFKALFGRARNRVEYLSLLTGRSPPTDADAWTDASLERILAHVDAGTAAPAAVRLLRRQVDETIAGFGVPLSRSDLETVDRFHHAFIDAGLALRFQSHGRAPRSYYPTFRELLLATDMRGHQWSYLAAEDDFQAVRSLQARDRVIPVVGDVSGQHALRAVGAAIAARGERLSAFYISNVEDYLFRQGVFQRYVENLGRLPRGPRSVMIRSIFSGGASASVVQPLDELLAGAAQGRYRGYWDLARSGQP